MPPLRLISAASLSLVLCSNTPGSAPDPLTALASVHHEPADYLEATESLLSAENPSAETTAAIAGRITALFESRPPKIGNVPTIAIACKMAILLHRADPESGLPILQKHTSHCLAAAKITGTAGDRFLSYAARFCQLRFESGKDPGALDDYIALVPTADPDAFTQLPDLLRFLLTYPGEPKLAALADSLFNETDGEWNPIVGLKDRYYTGYTARDIYPEPLLWKHPAFRKQFIRLLGNTDPIGHISMIDEESFAIGITGGWTDSMTDPRWEGQLPLPGTKVAIRVCDFHALYAARQVGVPDFQPFWSREKRDAAIADLRAHFDPAPGAP